MPRAAAEDDARRAGIELRGKFGAGDLEHVGVPVRFAGAAPCWKDLLARDTRSWWKARPSSAALDVVQPATPLALLGCVVALVPLLDGSEQAHGLFLAALEARGR